MSSDYYYLVSSLPELRLDDYKEPYRVNEFIEELHVNLAPEHFRHVQDVLYMNDNPNIIDIISGSGNTWIDSRGNWTFDQIKSFFAEPDLLDAQEHAYILGFINSIDGLKNEDNKVSRSQAEELLLFKFYAKMMQHKNGFIREYFNFDFQLRNILLAINKRKFNIDKVRFLESNENEIVRKLKTSTASDFNLAQEIDYVQVLIAAFEKDDIVYREKFIDQLRWDKIEQINTFSYFKLDTLLGFLIKLMMVERWIDLEENQGNEAFNKITTIDPKVLKQ